MVSSEQNPLMLNSEYTFDAFVRGKNCDLAYYASEAVAEEGEVEEGGREVGGGRGGGAIPCTVRSHRAVGRALPHGLGRLSRRVLG